MISVTALPFKFLKMKDPQIKFSKIESPLLQPQLADQICLSISFINQVLVLLPLQQHYPAQISTQSTKMKQDG